MSARTAALLILLLCAAGLRAHPILQNPLWIDPSEQKLTLYMHVTVRELVVIQGLTVDTEGRADPLAAADAADRHTGYVLDHFQIETDGNPLKGGKVLNITPPDEHQTGMEGPDNTRFVFLIEYPLAGLPQEFSFSHTMCKEYPTAPGVPWDFSYATRYGAPPLGTAKLFFPMVMEREYVIDTGRGELANGTATATTATAPTMVERPRQNHWLALWGIFGALSVCGAQSVRMMWLRGALAAWMTGYIMASVTGIPLLPTLAAVLCGVAALLLGIDNIHGSADARGLRRGVVLTAGAFCFGWALFAQKPDWVSSDRHWPLLALGAVVVVAVVFGIPAARLRRAGTPPGRAVLQIISLAGCGAAVWLILVLLDLAGATGGAGGR
jgi:hypothetical protein